MRLTLPTAVAGIGIAVLICAQPALALQTSPSSAATSAAATNTEMNKRDASNHTATPFDQSNKKSDIKLAAAVRRAIVKDKSLSTTAHNVKLIAADGVVTLRGPVKDANEKSAVETLVKGVNGVTEVNNQLDVKN